MKDKYTHSRAYYGIMTFIMYSVTIALVLAMSLIRKIETGDIVANLLISIICITVIVFYLTKERIAKVNFTKQLASYGRIISVYGILFISSFIFTFISSDMRPMFLIGVIMTLVSNEYLAILFHIYLSVMLTILSSASSEVLIYYVLTGLVGCAVAKYFTQKKNMIYAAVIMITSNLALSGILEYMQNETLSSKNIIRSLLCTLGGIVVIILTLPYIYYRVNYNLKAKLNYITNPDYELIVMLKNYSKELYHHSHRVAKLSERVAYKVGADPLLARAGGYYHKIGKLEGKDYVKHGVEIAISYSFPQELIDIIRQHTGRTQVPKSVEAAIVMLADTIISAFEYLEGKQDELLKEKNLVIDQVIDTKLNKDMLDESGLSLKMYRDIKKCFKQEDMINDL